MADFSRFGEYYRENMHALGLIAPDTIPMNMGAILGHVGALSAFLEKMGPRVTVADMVGAGLLSERIATLGGMYASFYVGAAIGSIAVATGRCLGNGTTIGEVLFSANQHNMNRPWLAGHLARYPVIFDQGAGGRASYRHQAMA